MNHDGIPESEPTAPRTNPLIAARPAPAASDERATDDSAQDSARSRLTRRRFLVTGAASGVAAGGVAIGVARSQEADPATPAGTAQEAVEDVATVTGEHAEHVTDPAAPTNEGFTFFVPFQASIVQAAAARLIPTDELGPGATEAGVVYFIDRQLTAYQKGYRGKQYQQGPFLSGETTQGDQSALRMPDRFRLGIIGIEGYAQQVFARPFVALAPEEQDRVLQDMEAGIPETFGGASIAWSPASPAGTGQEAIEQAGQVGVGAKAFFDLLLAYTVAGFFSDPVNGGNRDMVGWKLIGFPGAHVGYPNEILNYGVPFEGEYISLGQYQNQISGGV